MPDCECIPACPFFNGLMAQLLPAVVEAMKRHYCMGDKSQCARYAVRSALGSGEFVPKDLAPNEPDMAREIIARMRREQSAGAR